MDTLKQAQHPKFVKGGKYNWTGQPERLVYLGYNWSGNGYWHQFALTSDPSKVWCDVESEYLSHFEETREPPP